MDKSLIMAIALCRWIAEHHNLLTSGHRRRPKLSRLRPGPQGLPGRLFGLLQEDASPPARNGRGPREWQLSKNNYRQFQDPPAYPRRLGAGEAVTGAESGYTQSPRRPLQPRSHHRHRPSARGPVARRHQRSHPGADAILKRLIHNAYKINLKGEPMRKKLASLIDCKTPVA
ncbi:hypothetical protein DFAR_200026 [Desulfarculales bacterium]